MEYRMTTDSEFHYEGNTVILKGIFKLGGGAVSATATTALAGDNNDLKLTAIKPGVEGNNISLEYIDSGNGGKDFSLTVENDYDIKINCEYSDSEYASITTSYTPTNSNYKIRAKDPGLGGNSITVAIKDPGIANSSATITVTSNTITINLATDSTGLISSTVASLRTLVNGSATARAKINFLLEGGDGSGLAVPLPHTHLSGGGDGLPLTTALDVKVAIESNTLTKNLVRADIPEGQTGQGTIVTMSKVNLSGGGNSYSTDVDNDDITITIYDPWQNVLDTITSGISKVTTGEYHYYYTAPTNYIYIIHEWKCKVNNYDVVARQQVNLDWSLPENATPET
jgi:hypothetical protein